MSDYLQITEFLEPINIHQLTEDEGYKDGQIGKMITLFDGEFPNIDGADLVLLGCNETRGSGFYKQASNAANSIRKEFYKLFYWHTDIQLADIGNVKMGASLADSYAALRMVITALMDAGKTVIILGGTHDLTLAQYHAYVNRKEIIEAACVDALINLDIDNHLRSENFLMEMLTDEPNYIRHYNHIGFQSYFVHPRMLETMDKLRFDCFRVGHVKENVEEMEPALRNCKLFSFDMAAFANAYAPGSAISPNGFTGEEACTLMRYTGMSPMMNTIGIYGYEPSGDTDNLTAKQISHMLWYVMDGRSRGKREAKLDDKDAFYEFNTVFAEVETVFLQSKKTGRWWMQLPDKKLIACSYKDYMLASTNEIPERWLRAQERS